MINTSGCPVPRICGTFVNAYKAVRHHAIGAITP